VADTISGKSLPPSRSFCAVKQDGLSALNKSDIPE
jgi:hypothetical protein